MDVADMSDDRIEFDRQLGVQAVIDALKDEGDQVIVMAEDGAPMILCSDCDNPIPPDRLAAKPNAVRCIYCQTSFERGMN